MKILSECLLQIYRVARNIPSPEFKESTLETIKEFINFDSALWGTTVFTPNGAIVHGGHLYNQPMQMILDYEQIKQHDFLHFKSVANPGRTYNINTSHLEKKIHPAALSHMHRYFMEQILSTVVIDPALNVCTAVSLYRRDRKAPYTERERRLKQSIMPHLIEAWNFNTLLYISHEAGFTGKYSGSRALIDRTGMLYNAEPGFAETIRMEFPEWRGPYLPDTLTNAFLNNAGGSYKGNTLSADILYRAGQDRLLIGIRTATRIHRLSARELMVAREFAAGKTHKEIAQVMGVSPATVRNQIRSVYAKLGVSSKIDLAKLLKDMDSIGLNQV